MIEGRLWLEDNVAHAISSLNAEFTLCGVAWDEPVDRGESTMTENWGAVNCPRCLTVVAAVMAYVRHD